MLVMQLETSRMPSATAKATHALLAARITSADRLPTASHMLMIQSRVTKNLYSHHVLTCTVDHVVPSARLIRCSSCAGPAVPEPANSGAPHARQRSIVDPCPAR